ncbi:hypothetical protein L0337_27400 [candidate division KSB1 bacterium]|nr:hypothetical protein [candidate division KSB1 bacterium]
MFQEIVSFKKLAVFISPGVLAAIPQLRDRARQEVQALGAQLEFVLAATSSAMALQALPADAMRFILRLCSKCRQMNLICWWRA